MTPKVSLIVPVYNVEKYLERCVESILVQSYKNLEIVLVDDGSTDNSGQICDKYKLKDERIAVIHKENGGLSSARNAGIENSHGEYLGFVDSDDLIEPLMIEKMIKKMQNDGSQICCCGRFDIYGEKKVAGLCPLQTETVKAENALIKLLCEKECDVSCCDKIFCKTLFDGIGFPIGEINEDAGVIHLLFSKAEKISFVAERFYNYVHHKNSITSTSFNEGKLVVVKHAKAIKEFVLEKYPSLKDNAESFYVRKLMDVCILINLANRKTRKRYKKLYAKIIKEIKPLKQFLGRAEKLKYIFLRIKVYFLVKPIIMKAKIRKGKKIR